MTALWLLMIKLIWRRSGKLQCSAVLSKWIHLCNMPLVQQMRKQSLRKWTFLLTRCAKRYACFTPLISLRHGVPPNPVPGLNVYADSGSLAGNHQHGWKIFFACTLSWPTLNQKVIHGYPSIPVLSQADLMLQSPRPALLLRLIRMFGLLLLCP